MAPTDLSDSDYDALSSVGECEMNSRFRACAVGRLVGITIGLVSVVDGGAASWANPLEQPREVPPEIMPPELSASTLAIDLLELPPSEIQADSPADLPADLTITQIKPEIQRHQDAPKIEAVRVPAGQGEIITAIELRFVDRTGQPVEGITQPVIITREFELEPGDAYDPVLAEAGLKRVIGLSAIHDASILLEPAADPTQATMVLLLRESSPVAFELGNDLARPSVLRGITLPPTVPTVPARLSGIQLPASVQWRNIGGLDQSLTFGVLAGNRANGFDLTFANPWIAGTNRFGYSINLQGIGYLSPTFNVGDVVKLPTNNEDMWERRLGGGAQIVQNPTPELGWAAGISYEQVSIREALTGSRLFTRDRDGNRLLLSDDGTDMLLTLNAALNYDSRNAVTFPTQGQHFQIGLDQSIPVGDANVFYSRPTANFTQYLPLNFIRVGETPSTLLFNLQGGTLLGDAPPYEAFTLGGPGSVRGYGLGEMASPQTYLQTTVEYRAPFAALSIKPRLLRDALGEQVLFAANAFADYGTGFGTQALITGEPGVLRGKPGEGFGIGLGLMAASNIGLARLEAAINDEGDITVYFTIGDRF